MGKHNHEQGSVWQQAKRFLCEQARRRFVGARARRQFTYVTALFAVATLLYANVEDVWARPMLAAAPSLGTSSSFAVLAGSTATNTGPTSIVGDIGVSPGTAITGFPPGVVTGGTIHAGDAVAAQAQADVIAAYNNLAGQAFDQDLTNQNLGGQTLLPGVYRFSTSAQLTGILTLDGQGDPNAVFVFQIGSTLTTASNASVLLINGASDCNVFWQIGSSATLGTDTAFAGSILALTSITLNTSANLLGRALARNGAVTMDTNNISMLCTLATPTPTPLATATPTPVATATPTPVNNTPTPVATATPTPVNNTPTPVATATPTPVNNTPTPVATATPTPVNNTPTPLATATPTPVNNTPTPLATATPTPVNNTPTPLATATPTPVNNTPTPLATATPTPVNNTPTPLATATPTPVNNTPTPLATATPTPESALQPPTGLHPIDEPSLSTRTLYLPFLVK